MSDAITITFNENGKRIIERNKGVAGCKVNTHWPTSHNFKMTGIELQASNSFKCGFHFSLAFRCEECGLSASGHVPLDKFFLARDVDADDEHSLLFGRVLTEEAQERIDKETSEISYSDQILKAWDLKEEIINETDFEDAFYEGFVIKAGSYSSDGGVTWSEDEEE